MQTEHSGIDKIYREGFSKLEGCAGLIRQGEWSDAFFNYVPTEQCWDDDDAESLMLETAKQFVECNKDCPYTPELLVWDFYRHL